MEKAWKKLRHLILISANLTFVAYVITKSDILFAATWFQLAAWWINVREDGKWI